MRQQLKTSALSGQVWFSLLASFLPAWPGAPQEWASHRAVLPSTRDKDQLWLVPAHCYSKRRHEGWKWNLDKYVPYIQLPPNVRTVTTSLFVQIQRQQQPQAQLPTQKPSKPFRHANCFCNHLLVPKLYILTPLLTRRAKANTKFWISLLPSPPVSRAQVLACIKQNCMSIKLQDQNHSLKSHCWPFRMAIENCCD